MSKTLIVAVRVLKQLRGDKRLLGLSIMAPLAIIYFLKLFFDTMPPMFPVSRYVVPVAAFIVHFIAFLLCAIVLVRERSQGTLVRMFINGFTRTNVIAGYLLGYLGLATLQALAALAEVVLLFSLDYSATILLELFVVVWLLAIASVMLGIFISTFARNEGQVFPFVPMIVMPSVFLSGLLIDVALLPKWAELLGHALPLFYANRVIQEVIKPGGEIGDELASLLALIGYSIVLLFLASLTLKEIE